MENGCILSELNDNVKRNGAVAHEVKARQRRFLSLTTLGLSGVTTTPT